MNKRIVRKDIGNTDAIRGKIDRIDCNLFMIKGKKWTIKLISTHRILEV